MPVLRATLAVNRLHQLAAQQAGVVSRAQANRLGVTRAQERADVRARRWRRIGSQSIGLSTGPLSVEARHWAAVGYRTDRVRVSVPRGARVRRARGLEIRQTRRWQADDLVATGVPPTTSPVAAVRAALWARTDRQAALLLTMSVQQGLTSAWRRDGSSATGDAGSSTTSSWTWQEACVPWGSWTSLASAGDVGSPNPRGKWSGGAVMGATTSTSPGKVSGGSGLVLRPVRMTLRATRRIGHGCPSAGR